MDHGRRALTLAALIGVIGLAAQAQPAAAGRQEIISGSVAVQAAGRATYPVTVGPDMLNPRISGRLVASGGAGNDIIVGLMGDADYVNYVNGHRGTPLYYSDQVTVADVRASLPGPGSYVLFLDNSFSGLTPKTVAGNLALQWDEPPPTEAAPPPPATPAKGTGSSSGLALAFAAVALISAVIGALVGWGVGRRRKSA